MVRPGLFRTWADNGRLHGRNALLGTRELVVGYAQKGDFMKKITKNVLLGTVILGAFSVLVSSPVFAKSETAGALSELGSAIKKDSADLWDSAKGTAGKAWKSTKRATRDAKNKVSDSAEDVWDGAKDKAEEAWDATKAGAKKAGKAAGKAVKDAKDAFQSETY